MRTAAPRRDRPRGTACRTAVPPAESRKCEATSGYSANSRASALPAHSGSSGARMQVIIKTSGESRPDSGDLFKIGNAGPQYALQPTEVFQQLAALRRSEARNALQDRLVVTLGALAPVSRNGETVRLIANPLNQPRRRRVRFRNVRIRNPEDEQPLLPRFAVRPLGHTHERHIRKPQFLELFVYLGDLSQPTVDQQQVRRWNLAVPDPRIAPLERLAKCSVVIPGSHTGDVESPVFLLQRPLGSKDHARRNGPLTACVADIETFNARWRLRKIQLRGQSGKH